MGESNANVVFILSLIYLFGKCLLEAVKSTSIKWGLARSWFWLGLYTHLKTQQRFIKASKAT